MGLSKKYEWIFGRIIAFMTRYEQISGLGRINKWLTGDERLGWLDSHLT